jgi:hypothetical protein
LEEGCSGEAEERRGDG